MRRVFHLCQPWREFLKAHSDTAIGVSFPQDQFDNLEKHTQWGIEFLERYAKFVKERSEIEINYAKQIR